MDTLLATGCEGECWFGKGTVEDFFHFAGENTELLEEMEDKNWELKTDCADDSIDDKGLAGLFA